MALNGVFYISGLFEGVGSIAGGAWQPAWGIAQWTNGTLLPVGSGTDLSWNGEAFPAVTGGGPTFGPSVAEDTNNVYVIGGFNEVDGNPAGGENGQFGVARWTIVPNQLQCGLDRRISGGWESSLAATYLGTAWGWGRVPLYGDGSSASYLVPVQITNLVGLSAVACSFQENLSLRYDGTVWGWGDNSYGSLGNGTGTTTTVPVQAYGLTNVVAIAAGVYSGYAVKSDGTLWSWGFNNYGQLGDGTTTDRSEPVQGQGISNVCCVASGWYHCLAITTNGTVYSWGENNYGQLGDGTQTQRHSPVQVVMSTMPPVTAISCGVDNSLALDTNGDVWAWGANEYGQLGDGTTTTRITPVQVTVFSNAISVKAGELFGTALTANRSIFAWGYNNQGELGNGTTGGYSTTPAQIMDMPSFLAIGAGDAWGLAIDSNYSMWSWGWNDSGSLGNGTTSNEPSPVEVLDINMSPSY